MRDDMESPFSFAIEYKKFDASSVVSAEAFNWNSTIYEVVLLRDCFEFNHSYEWLKNNIRFHNTRWISDLRHTLYI